MSGRRGFLNSALGMAAAGWVEGQSGGGAPPPAGFAAQGGGIDWTAVQAQFALDPGQLFFNPGTLGSCPRPVRERVAETLALLDAQPTFGYWALCMPRFFELQARAARLLNAPDPASVTITHSTTEGMNVVARGLRLASGDEVVTTNHEHVGGESIFRHLERTAGVRLKRLALPFVPPPDAEIVDGVRKLITPRTRLLMVSHVLFTNGFVMPVAELAQLANRHGIYFLVDGAHPPGQMAVDVQAINCDFYAASGHKWLCGPRGTGLLYVRPSLIEKLEPLIVSYDLDDPPKDARKFNEGATRLNFAWTNNLHDMMGLDAAIAFHQELGAARVRERCAALIAHFSQAVAGVPGLEPIALPEARSAPMLTLRVKGKTNKEVFRALKKLAITVKEVDDHEMPEPINAIRVATHVFNSEEQLDRLVAALRQVMAG